MHEKAPISGLYWHFIGTRLTLSPRNFKLTDWPKNPRRRKNSNGLASTEIHRCSWVYF